MSDNITIRWGTTETAVESMVDAYLRHVEETALVGAAQAFLESVGAFAAYDYARGEEGIEQGVLWLDALTEAQWYRVHQRRAFDRWADDGGRA